MHRLFCLLISITIGLIAATRVHNAKDFAVAGRHLPLPIVMATVFATWFGAETVLGISATFVKDGLRGVVADPFGSSLCLILAGLFFAKKLYRMNLLTIGDYYRLRYNRTVEVLCTLAIVASYLGWVAAQIKAPPVRFANVYGIDMPTRDELIATGRSDEEIAREIGADQLIYQDLSALIDDVRSVNPKVMSFEDSCFSGNYVTGDVTQAYLDGVEAQRREGGKQAAFAASQLDLNLEVVD